MRKFFSVLMLFSMYSTTGYTQTCSNLILSTAKSMEILINNVSYIYTIKSDGDRFSQTLTAGGKDFVSYFNCKNDTFYYYKFDSPQYGISGSDTTSISFYGTCKIPMSLNIGDTISQFVDMTTNHYSHAEMGEAVKVTSYMTSYTSGGYRYNYIVSESEYHKALVNSVFSGGFYTINYVNATVTGKEKFVFDNKEYTAYKINCENWTKTILSVASSSDDAVVNKKYEKSAKKSSKKMEKISNQLADNKQGYKVSPIEQWFVPELGFVKTLIYNNEKTIITGKIELKSIK